MQITPLKLMVHGLSAYAETISANTPVYLHFKLLWLSKHSQVCSYVPFHAELGDLRGRGQKRTHLSLAYIKAICYKCTCEIVCYYSSNLPFINSIGRCQAICSICWICVGVQFQTTSQYSAHCPFSKRGIKICHCLFYICNIHVILYFAYCNK